VAEIEILHCPFCLLVYPASAGRCPPCGLALAAGEPSEVDPAVESAQLADPAAILDLPDPVDGQFIVEALEQEGIPSRIAAVDEGGEIERFRLLVEAGDAEHAREVIEDVAPAGAGAREPGAEGDEEGAEEGDWDAGATGASLGDDPRRRRARRLDRARMLAGYGAVKAARRMLESAVEDGGAGDDALLVGAHIFAQAGQPDRARELYIQILQRHPGVWEAAEGLASILESAGGDEGRSRALDLRHGLYKSVRRHIRLGWMVVDASRALGDEERAIEVLLKIAGVNPVFRDAAVQLLDAWTARSRPIGTLLDSIEPDPPAFAGPYIAIAQALRGRGRLAEAELVHRKGLDLAPKSVSLRHEIARWHLAQADRGHHAREAAAILDALDRDGRGDPAIARDLLRALVAIGDRRAAKRLAERIIDLTEARGGDEGKVRTEIEGILDGRETGRPTP